MTRVCTAALSVRTPGTLLLAMGVLGRVLVPALLLRPAAAQPALKFAFDVDVSSWDVWFNHELRLCCHYT